MTPSEIAEDFRKNCPNALIVIRMMMEELLERAALECEHDDIPMDNGEGATASACASRVRALKAKL